MIGLVIADPGFIRLQVVTSWKRCGTPAISTSSEPVSLLRYDWRVDVFRRIAGDHQNRVNIDPDDPKWRWAIIGPDVSKCTLGNLPHSQRFSKEEKLCTRLLWK